MQMQTQHIRSQAVAQALQHQRLQSTQLSSLPSSSSSSSSPSSSSNLMPHIGRVSTTTLNANGMVNLNSEVNATNTFATGNGLRNGTMMGGGGSVGENDPAATIATMPSAAYSTLQMMGTPSGTATTIPGGMGVGGLAGSRASPTQIQTQAQAQTPGRDGAISPGLGTGGKNNIITDPSSTTNVVGGEGSKTSSTLRMMEPATATVVAGQVHASVSHLLTRAYSLPCSTAAQAFAGLVQPIARFQLALDALLPLLDSAKSVELSQRILVSFILYSLYAPYPITINPFRSVLFVAYVQERGKAIQVADEGGTSPNEQLVWVLWKILKGDGNDIGPYSPSTLARSPLPTKLRAVNLVLDDEMYDSGIDLDDATYSYFQKQQNMAHGQPALPGWHSNGFGAVTSLAVPFSGQSAAVAGITRSPITSEEDRRNERVVQGMRLLLAARERILTIAEQRVLLPLINDVTSSRIITSLDFTPIVARNPLIAHPLFVGLLCNASGENSNISQFLDVLPFLPPSLTSMDVMGRLLHDKTFINKIPGYSTVADLVRMEVLGRFIHECINWLEHAEREEKEGLISDDRFAKGVQNLCRFFSSLIKLQIIDSSSDADTAEMTHFTLRYSRFEEANILYRHLAMSRY